ncbi:hypothetical protein EDB83DRAFT_2426167 [Lactarius deliciosus]|nr:hypothetical protein EDB83DRAFT_2426167 [Lactarius deliciosus]
MWCCSSRAIIFLVMASSFLVTTCDATSLVRLESWIRSRNSHTKNASRSETNASWSLTPMDPLVTARVSAPLKGRQSLWLGVTQKHGLLYHQRK